MREVKCPACLRLHTVGVRLHLDLKEGNKEKNGGERGRETRDTRYRLSAEFSFFFRGGGIWRDERGRANIEGNKSVEERAPERRDNDLRR